MRKNNSKKALLLTSLVGLCLATSASQATDVYLKSQAFDKSVTTSETVPMWGFAECTDATFTNCGSIQSTNSPGPKLDISSGEPLAIHLMNSLSIPVSIVIPGQTGEGDPVMVNDTLGRARVQSFTHETAPGATGVYNWSTLKTGTFLYQSGTYPSIQVPMGLYGALVVRAGETYSDTVSTDIPSHYYQLGDQSSGVALDQMQSAINGVYGSAVTTGSLGYETDDAAAFTSTDANSYVDTNITTLSNSSFSVEAWANASDLSGRKRIVAKDEIGTPGQFILWFNNGNLRFQVNAGASGGGNSWIIAQAPVAPTAGKTFHVVGTFDGNDVVLFVDGIEVARTSTGVAGAVANTNTLPITIGADSDIVGARGHRFNGVIDEVAIYESVLSAATVQQHFAANSSETVLLFSEIDPLQNQRTADAEVAGLTPTPACVGLKDYAEQATLGYPCTIDYNPVALLVNGESSTSLKIGNPGGTALLRMLNAGLRSHTPSLVGMDMKLIAEDGNPYPGLPREQSHALLPAGKTMDALIEMPALESDGVTPANATITLFDRMPSFTSPDTPDNSGLASLQIGSGAAPSTSSTSNFEEVYAVVEDTPLVIDPTGGNGVELLSSPTNGTIVEIPATGTTQLNYEYTPNPNFSGTDFFTYQRNNGFTYHVTLNVSFVNDTPVASADSYGNTSGDVLTVAAPGVLANDGDIDGDNLTAVIDGAAPAGLTFNADGSFTYSGPSTSFSYHAVDSSLSSNIVTVDLTMNAVSNIALTVHDPDGTVLTDYRWVVEENAMWHPDPYSPPPAETLATSFHKSYMPVVAQGNGAAEFAQLALDPTKHYYVSILPSDAASGAGHTVGGNDLPAGATSLDINVNNQPLPTAQISIFVYEDRSPTNGAVDGAEQGLGLGGFQITLEEAGGRYGASGGMMGQDVNGDPLKNSLDCFGDSQPPAGIILSCPDTPENRTAGLVGEVLIKNLYPGKYGIIGTAAPGPENWISTTTIEGTKVIDAWVKAGEPPFFQEFGPGKWHVWVGFVNPDSLVMPAGGTNTINGKVTNMHLSRPPNQQLVDSDSYEALSHTRAWVGLNSAGGNGENIATVQANEDGTFTIPNVPDGLYQLAIWDTYLDQVIAYRGVSLPGGGEVGNVPVFNWFARTEHNVFLDANQNGVRDEGELPLPEQAINLRWRDGTINQSFPTDSEGFVPFDETFPFFHWQVLEVDYARFKATGLTVQVDGGGDVSTGPYPGVMSPQQQGPCNQDDVDNNWNGCTVVGAPYANQNQRTETGPVLTQGFQGFLGQTSIFDWGKAPYQVGENGGISGIVYYSSTRAENDPRLAAAETWEPGIPSVTIRLYRVVATEDGGTSLALVEETQTDSWDKSLPTGCPGADPSDAVITGGALDKCYDGLRNFNQARPAVFDGGYAFNDIPAGQYVVEMVPPPGYELLKEEDNNVAYGDVFANVPVAVMLPNGAALFALTPDPATVVEAMSPEPGLAQPACVGADRVVPPYLSLFPNELAEAPFAGSTRPLCDRKMVTLPDQGQAAADFFLFTGTPVASHFTGMILDDLAQEYDVNSPQFSEKWAPPYVPVSIRDYKGVEISRVYSDQWGRMNGMVPSSFSANMPSPSGFSPAMWTTCMNDPGPIIDKRAGSETFGQSIVDPQYNPGYSNFCYTFQYMAGATTYLDTPVLPISAFASGDNPVDCALDEGTPMIKQVDGTGVGPLVAPGGTLRITSMGTVQVSNPAYAGPLSTGIAGEKRIPRNYGFGAAQGTGSVTLGGQSLVVTSWSDDVIEAVAPSTVNTGQLTVTRDNGNSNEDSISVTVSNVTPIRVTAGNSIQSAIDNANPGDLIIVEPGSYEELVIMWKPVRLQGAGAGVTFINALQTPSEKMAAWRTKMDCLFGIGAGCVDRVDSLPTQQDGAIGFNTEEGAGITVVGVFDSGSNPRPTNSFDIGRRARIDGFSITGASTGGGIFVNGNAHRLEISNNRVFGNSGLYGGGIRVGRPYLELNQDGNFNFNRQVNIHNNMITQNGGLGGAGGGLSIHTGTDRYRVTSNYVCGNFTTGDGGGIGHMGLSDNGRIDNNKILFNQSFSQSSSRSGGGLLVAGEPPVVDGLTHGSGDVVVSGNLIQGNQAGAGHGGGIRTQFVNGRDIANSINPRNGRARPGRWYRILMANNIITNNVAGWSGAGISLQDTARSIIINNTIANNDNTSTVTSTFTTGDPNISANQPAGISSEPHSLGLANAIPSQGNTDDLREFSNPDMSNNIIWQNRSFHYDGTLGYGAHLVPALQQTFVGECANGANYDDLGVLGGGFSLNPLFSVLTDISGYDASNTSSNPGLLQSYCNGGRALDGVAPGAALALPAVDEAGATWIDVRYGPLSISGGLSDYHIGSPSSAIDAATSANAPTFDYDGDRRPANGVDIGADEL